MTLHSTWGKGCKLNRYQMHRYYAYQYGSIVIARIGISGILDRFLKAHIKDTAHIYVCPINSSISKFETY